MSTILYCNNTLVSDSGGVIVHDDIHLFSRNKLRKIYTSRCNCVAMAIVGRGFMSDDDAQDVADIFAFHLKKNGHLSAIDEDLLKPLEEAMFKHAAFFSFILMTSIGKAIYTIDSDMEDKKPIVRLSRLKSDEVFALGSGFLFAHTAILSGLDPIEAVRFAIKHDNVSRHPIKHIHMDDLTEYIPEVKEETVNE